MKYLSFILAVLLATFFIWQYDVENNDSIYKSAAVGVLLVIEIFAFGIFRKRISQKPIIKVRANGFLLHIILLAAVIYVFLEEGIDLWNLITYGLLLSFACFRLVRSYYTFYQITENGILDLGTNRLEVSRERITKINIEADKLAIDTTKYVNDLVIKSKDLIKPSWDELTAQISALDNTHKSGREDAGSISAH